MSLNLGLDIGIASVGWAVVNDNGDRSRIEGLGVRLFDSGESTRVKDTKNQIRRQKRGARRNIRRRKFRREYLKNYLEEVGLISSQGLMDKLKMSQYNPYELKYRGQKGKLMPWELGATLLHYSNHRGYNEFYESEESNDEKREIAQGLKATEVLKDKGGYKTVSEMIMKDTAFRHGKTKDGSERISVRNKNNYKYMFTRKELRYDAQVVLEEQANYYNILTRDVRDRILSLIFNQRYFEEGPNYNEDWSNKAPIVYKGYRESIGHCTFYKGQRNGAKCSILYELFVFINEMSKVRYIDSNTKEIVKFNEEIGRLLLEDVIEKYNQGWFASHNLNKTQVNKILKKININIEVPDKMKLAINDLKIMKRLSTIIQENESAKIQLKFELDNKSKPFGNLQELATTLQENITPKKREEALEHLTFDLDPEIINNLTESRVSGTSNLSDKYMYEAIIAFKNGVIYGDFQADFIKKCDSDENNTSNSEKLPKLPPINDVDMIRNPVVFRALNETRKVINNIIEKYGSIEPINQIMIETADELYTSQKKRNEIIKTNQQREKKRNDARKVLEELLPDKDIKNKLIDMYLLWETQNEHCMYSNKTIKIEHLKEYERLLEIDHIVPYSLILDNTLNNKVLVFIDENQNKGQKIPLKYLKEKEAKEAVEFKNRVTRLRKDGKISEKKFKYLMLEELTEELIQEFKSRNLNDTRYITRYIVSYLNKYIGKECKILPIKSQVVSKFRRWWLRDSIWTKKDREANDYHHAVDSLILANMTKEYIEYACDYVKLDSIKKENYNKETQEYRDYLSGAKEKMQKYYRNLPEQTEAILRGGFIPSIVPKLSQELNMRLANYQDDEQLQEKARSFYAERGIRDEKFIQSIHIPFISHKIEKKFSGNIQGSQNPMKVVVIDDEFYEVTTKDVASIKEKNIDKFYINDNDIRDTLCDIFAKGYSISDYLNNEKVDYLLTKGGKKVKRLKLIGKKTNVYKKEIDDKNYSFLSKQKYYCSELYKDKKGKLKFRGIPYLDVIKKDKKLYYVGSLPDDYCEHIMYLFKNEYIRIYNNEDNIKFDGNYKSIKDVNKSKIWYKDNKNTEPKKEKIYQFAQKDSIKKYEINILGKICGEVKCGDQLLFKMYTS